MAYQADNRGFMAPNKYRQEGSKQPDWKGKIRVAGKEYEIAGWTRTNDRGEYIGLQVGEPRAKVEKPATQAAPADLDDEVPFEMDR